MATHRWQSKLSLTDSDWKTLGVSRVQVGSATCSATLTEGTHYEIDYYQGRVRPINGYASSAMVCFDLEYDDRAEEFAAIAARPVAVPAHTHVLQDVADLPTDLAAKADATHSHPELAGTQGLQGPAGPKGDRGDAGPAGAPGTTGAVGATGSTGLTGPQGPTGLTGPQGAQGVPGPAGAAGAVGLTGPAGATGSAGATGPQGLQGIVGPQGPVGPGMSRVVLALDVSNANAVANTLQDVTGLAFAVVAGLRYRFRFYIPYTAAAITTGSRWTINGPAVTVLHYRSEYSLTTASRTTNDGQAAYGLPAAANASSAATGSNIATIDGIVTPSANGTVLARCASRVAASAIVAKSGAYVEWEAY